MDWPVSALASIDFYMTVFGLGVIVRFGIITGVPAILEPFAHSGVMFLFGALYLIEHVAEKIPVVAVGWNWAHAVIKPISIVLFVIVATFDIGVSTLIMAVPFAFVITVILSLVDAKLWTFLGLVPVLPVVVTLIEDVVVFVLMMRSVTTLVGA
jgi:hypothetical protein